MNTYQGFYLSSMVMYRQRKRSLTLKGKLFKQIASKSRAIFNN
ncbi:hypothetical protein [Nostoc flagelliforme]|nr:hypothetical protein [Nostoc flagelliforme]